MKKILVLAAAIVLVSSSAFAAGTATLNVSANVIGTCTISGGDLVFPNLNSLTALAVGPILATGVGVNCTVASPFTVIDDSAIKPLTNGTNTFGFTLNHTGSGVGTGAYIPYAINGSIAAGVYAGVPAGLYTSTVILTVNP